jgi:uncharacterized protein YlzI (FlbEa/FlbD family)
MIRLTRLDESVVYVNVDAIVMVEETSGGAVLKLNNGEIMRVLEAAADVAALAREFRAATIRQAFGMTVPAEVLAMV